MPKYKEWTDAARECHARGLNCEGCYYKPIMQKTYVRRCKMRDAVRELIKNVGLPDKVSENKKEE